MSRCWIPTHSSGWGACLREELGSGMALSGFLECTMMVGLSCHISPAPLVGQSPGSCWGWWSAGLDVHPGVSPRLQCWFAWWGLEALRNGKFWKMELKWWGSSPQAAGNTDETVSQKQCLHVAGETKAFVCLFKYKLPLVSGFSVLTQT